MTKCVTIHQPNFFPWLGYFDKIMKSDVFIFIDDVQFPKTGGCWTNRVKLLVKGQNQWITGSIDRNYKGTRTILEMVYITKNLWREKLIKTIESNYGRHPYFCEVMEVIKPLILNKESNLAEYNIHAIKTICRWLKLEVKKLYRSSELKHENSSNKLLCSLTKTVKGDLYMFGKGSEQYQDEAIFSSLGIKLIAQNFVHPSYLQKNRQGFVMGLSIIDVAMNLGWKGVSELLGINR